MSVIDDLVAQGERLVHGIDWNSLDARSVGVPLDPAQPAHLNYWVEYLGPSFDRAANAINTLYYDPIIVNHAETEASLGAVWTELQNAAPAAWSQINLQNLASNAKQLLYSAFGSPIPLPAAQMRNIISYVWGVIMYGVKLHTTFAITSVSSDPAIVRATMRDHANRLVMLCEAIALLDQIGALNELKWDSGAMVELRQQQGVSALKPFYTPPMNTTPTATSGVGLGVAPVVMAIGFMLGAIVLMFAIYRWTAMTTEVNKATLQATKDLCTDPTYVNDPATKDRCIKILGDALADTTKMDPFGGALSTLAKYAVAGVLIAAAVYFAPTIVRSLKGAASEARKPATA
jgi:hypothetical protein